MRLGDVETLEGRPLAEITTALLKDRRMVDETLPLVVTGRMPWRTEIGSRGVSLSLRAIPLRDEKERFGALVLCRDVSELRRREMELVSKDATIREIHHRVKNNLQTVAALLRMQSRRMVSEEGKLGLEQAMRRVSTIALVHETLSQGLAQSVDFDELISRQFRLSAEVASPSQAVRTERSGDFGELPSDLATPLALVINELVTNAVEHGLSGRAGTVWLMANRRTVVDGEEILRVTIADDGVGLPAAWARGGTGTADRADPRHERTRRDHRVAHTGWRRHLRHDRAAAAPEPGDLTPGPCTDDCTDDEGPPDGQPFVVPRSRCPLGRVSPPGPDQDARRARAARRFSARRSSSLNPPQTPASCPDSMAHCRQVSCTWQRRQTLLASSI